MLKVKNSSVENKEILMSDRQRLVDLKKLLELLYEKLNYFERESIINSNANTNFELDQRMKQDILPKIRQYEAEYWQLYPREEIVISDEEAESQLVEVEQAVNSIENISSVDYPRELISLLQEIRVKLGELDQSASAKLKVVLPLIPMIASYELEMDSEGFMYKTWRAVRQLIKKKEKKTFS